MGAENNPGAFRHLRKLFHENGAGPPQFVHYVTIVNDFLANVDGRAIQVQRNFHDINGPHNTRTKAPRFQQENLLARVHR